MFYLPPMLLHISMCLCAMLCLLGLDSFLLFSDRAWQSLGFVCTKGLNLSTDSHTLVLCVGKSTSNKHICWCSHGQPWPLDPSSSNQRNWGIPLPLHPKDQRISGVLSPKTLFACVPFHGIGFTEKTQVSPKWLPSMSSHRFCTEISHISMDYLVSYEQALGTSFPPCAFEAHQMLYWWREGERFFAPSRWILFLSSPACCIKARELVTTGRSAPAASISWTVRPSISTLGLLTVNMSYFWSCWWNKHLETGNAHVETDPTFTLKWQEETYGALEDSEPLPHTA